jgi:hypothetical protein
MSPIEISEAAVDRLAARVKQGPLPPSPDFVYSRETPFFPPLGAPWAVSFFFAAALHFYGLWEEDGRRFTGAIRGFIDGRPFVGEDFLWKALWRTVQEEPRFPLASFQAALTKERLSHFFRNDAGHCPVPLLESHVELARSYGESLEKNNLSPHKILDTCRAAPQPVLELVHKLSDLPGYREDPLRRKAFFLALILSQRPERFLPAHEGWPPVLDRHFLRLALRWSGIQVKDPDLAEALRQGRTLPPPQEQALRLSAYEVFAQILRRSGRSVPETFGLFDGARRYCPEDAPPDCAPCFFTSACEKRIDLLQPVTRTMSY